MNDKNYQDRVLSTLANQYDTYGKQKAHAKTPKGEAIDDVVGMLTSVEQPARPPAELRNKEHREKLRQDALPVTADPMLDDKGGHVAPAATPMRSWNFEARTDILNIVRINKPTEKEIEMERPDISRLINRGLKISVNIGKDEEMQVYGKHLDTKVPPPGSKLKVEKLDGRSVAEIGF